MPLKSRAAVMKGYGEPLSIEYIDIPDPTGEAVVLKTAGAGVCHTDVHEWKGELGILPDRFPMALGHEFSGVVYARGEKVPEEFKEGTPVLVYPYWWEVEDEFVLTGKQQLARVKSVPGSIKYHGGYSEYVYVPSYKYLVPAHGIEDLAAASILTCAGLTSYSAVMKLKHHISPGDPVAIVGLGGLGLLGAQYVKLLGARAILIDIRDEVLELAAKIVKLDSDDVLLNATKVGVDEIYRVTDSKGVKAVVDFVGSSKTIETYLIALDNDGIYVNVGVHGDVVQIPVRIAVVRGITLTFNLMGSMKDLYDVAYLAKAGKIKYRELVTKIKLEDATKALEKLDRREVIGRQVIAF